MSATTGRERRVTAGRRMNDLVGKAAEDDETFWSHNVWEEDDSGNDSFRESDEDSDQRVDTFDSDFDDSESDHEDEEVEAGQAEEEELQRSERNSKKKGGYADIVKAGRDLMQKRKGTARKRKKDLMGDGMNAGLVLNFPGTAANNAAPGVSLGGLHNKLATPQRPPPLAPAVKQQKQDPLAKKRQAFRPTTETLASTRSRRSTHPDSRRQLRGHGSNHDNSSSTGAKPKAGARASKPVNKKPQRQFTQEELLLEAANVTEPENERWLLGRQRIQHLEELTKEASSLQKDALRGGRVVARFHSRRGCYNTITFPEMDKVPEILTRTSTTAPLSSQSKKKTSQQLDCVITGKKARYRDPKTTMRYYDLTAFKELRRRLKAGEPLDQRKKTINGAAKASVTNQTEPVVSNTQVAANANGKESHKKTTDPKVVPPAVVRPQSKGSAVVLPTTGSAARNRATLKAIVQTIASESSTPVLALKADIQTKKADTSQPSAATAASATASHESNQYGVSQKNPKPSSVVSSAETVTNRLAKPPKAQNGASSGATQTVPVSSSNGAQKSQNISQPKQTTQPVKYNKPVSLAQTSKAAQPVKDNKPASLPQTSRDQGKRPQPQSATTSRKKAKAATVTTANSTATKRPVATPTPASIAKRPETVVDTSAATTASPSRPQVRPKAASPTTASMINNALAAYTLFQKEQEQDDESKTT